MDKSGQYTLTNNYLAMKQANETVSFRVTHEDKQLLKDRATKQDVSTSEFCETIVKSHLLVCIVWIGLVVQVQMPYT